MACLTSCCCCYSLKTGAIVSGVCGIILAIATLIIMCIYPIDFRTIILDFVPDWLKILIIVINLIMTIIICSLLIWGAIKRNMYMMMPWVVLGAILIIGALISVLHTSIVSFLDGNNFYGTIVLVFGLLFFVLYVYMWTVTFSYFQTIRDEYAGGAYHKPPFARHPQRP